MSTSPTITPNAPDTPTASGLGRVQHPVAVGGRARALWAASQAIRLGLDVAVLAALGYLVTLPARGASGTYPSDAVLIGGFLLLSGAFFLARRVRWLAWAEVPGAWRAYSSLAQMHASTPDRRPDLVAGVLHALVWSAGGLYLAALPGQAPAVMVGFFGGVMSAHAATTLGAETAAKSLDRTRAGLVSWMCTIAPAFVWSAVGDHRLQLVGGVVGLTIVLLSILMRQAYGRV